MIFSVHPSHLRAQFRITPSLDIPDDTGSFMPRVGEFPPRWQIHVAEFGFGGDEILALFGQIRLQPAPFHFLSTALTNSFP